jgi:transglutaminase-like putative cysteine protease
MGFWGIPVSISSVATNPVDTDVSTVDTIHKMIAIARTSSSDSSVVHEVNTLLSNLHSNPSKREIARAIYLWIKSHVKFEEDEKILASQLGYEDVHQELLISPPVLLSMPKRMGDCDDFSMLAASMLLAAQIPCGFVTIAVDKNEPNRFSHVFVKCYLTDEGNAVNFDCSHGTHLGWMYKGPIYRYLEWKI